MINFAITEVLGDLLKIFLFYFERNIKINNVFKKNKKEVRYKKIYLKIVFDLDVISCQNLKKKFRYKIN